MLKDYQLTVVCGGDRWGAENSDGSVSEEESNFYSSGSTSYSTFSSNAYGSGANDPVACLKDTVAGGVEAAALTNVALRKTKLPSIYRGIAVAGAGIYGAAKSHYDSPNCQLKKGN